MGDGILNFGFAQDVAMESAVTTMKFRLKNPSQYYPMDNISVKLNIANGRPDKDGSLGAGSRSFANLVNPSITTLKNTGNSNITYDSASNVINIDKIKAGEEVDIDISICPPKGISKQLMRDFIGNEGLFEAYTNDFNNMSSWLEYEFTSGEGKHYAGITDVQHQEILPPPKVFVSYEIQPQGTDTDLYKLKVNVTNVGEGPAKGIVIFAPDIPLDGDAAEIRSAYSYKFGKSSDNSIRIGDLFSGETSYGEFVVYAPGIDDSSKDRKSVV